jgi:integrase
MASEGQNKFRPNMVTATTTTSTTTTLNGIENKIANATEGLPSECFKFLHDRVLPANQENAMIICNYMSSLKSEANPSDGHRRNTILLLCKFSIFKDTKTKPFMEITREDVLSFLDSFRKVEAVDPLHKWIGTYNTYRIHLLRFFKWLYNPNIEPDKRPKPEVVQNIPQLKRKEKSIYKPTDLWTTEDDFLFLKYCPNARDKCYHAMSRDSAARPHELLKLRIKDVTFRFTPDKKQYAEILVNGKTGARHIPLIDSIPYIKDWISQHPQSGNTNSILLCGFGKSLNRVISVTSLNRIYQDYKSKLYPKLLDNPNVLPEDKQKIRDLLKKPWNPYIRRHSALTEKSGILKENHLRQYAGWSPSSNMHLRYIHYFGNESSESLLEAYGFEIKNKQLGDTLRPKQCPNCNEPNKPDSRFCAKCRMVLTYDAYNETVEEKNKQDDVVDELRRKQEKFEQLIQSLVDSGQLKPTISTQ